MKFTPFPSLSTDRLLLKQLTADDAEQVLYLRSDPVLNEFIKRQKPQNIDDARGFIQKIDKTRANDKGIFWAINFKENPRMIGSICLWNFSEDQKTAEVGYELQPDLQRKGIMGEALRRVLKYGFEDLNLTAIEAYTHRENVASIALVEKNGFALLEGEIDSCNEDNIVFRICR